MLLNRVRLEALVSYFGPAETADMIGRAAAALAGRVDDMRRAPDAPLARRLGHEIKGLAGMYGLETVAAAALTIEREATDESLPEMITALERAVVDATHELAAFAAELAASPTKDAE